MNDITPELISQIATRLYNEIPGANMVPKTETDRRPSMPEFPTGVSSIPSPHDSFRRPQHRMINRICPQWIDALTSNEH